MTHKIGRNGRKYCRSSIDPRGSWAPGTPASAGFIPEKTSFLEKKSKEQPYINYIYIRNIYE